MKTHLKLITVILAIAGISLSAAPGDTLANLDFATDTFSTNFTLRNGNGKASTLGSTVWDSNGHVSFGTKTAAQEYSYFYTTPIDMGAGIKVSFDMLGKAYTSGSVSRTAIGLSYLDPTLGTSQADLNLTSSNNIPQARLIKGAADTTARLESRNTGTDGTQYGVSLEDDTWHTFSVSFLLVLDDDSNPTFKITSELIDLNLGSTIASSSGTIAASAMSNFFDTNGNVKPIYVGLLSQNANGGALAFDNFTITELAAIPEPSAYAFFGAALAIMAIMIHRRKKR